MSVGASLVSLNMIVESFTTRYLFWFCIENVIERNGGRVKFFL